MKILSLTINDMRHEVLVHPHDTLNHVLREYLNLTGTKTGCEQGSCGACTVLVGRKAVQSCIYPALKCQGKRITTIEGIATKGSLHGLQEKFVEKGAIQCGYCTPGMVMSAISFLEENPYPSVPEIKEALSGNLCRCTGYKKIIEAVAEYVRENVQSKKLLQNDNDQVAHVKENARAKETVSENGNSDQNGNVGDKINSTENKNVFDALISGKSELKTNVVKKLKAGNRTHSMVGHGRPYLEARKKVTGEAEYADDIRIKNALSCRFLRSVFPHARIISIDTTAAENLPGVRAVITGKDLPIKFGVLPISQDETAIAIDKTRYIGEIVAAVAADTEVIAKAACQLINVEYEVLHPFLEMEESLEDIGEYEQIHAYNKEGSYRVNNNIHKKAEMRFGDQRNGLDNADFTSKVEFDFKGVTHAFTEPHAATAYWDHDGLTIITATQVPHYLHRYLSKVMEVQMNRVRVIKPHLGGGFGGKSDPFPHEMIVAHLSRLLGQPVRVRLNREEVFLTNHGRHPTKMSMEMGVSKEGIFEVLDADILIDGGAYGSFGVVTSYYNGVLLQAPYKIDNFGFRTQRVYTNKPQSGAMRGHGAVNPRYAVETIIDRLAEKIGMDPCALRLKNFLVKNTNTVGEFRITSNGSIACLNAVMEQSQWTENYGKLPEGHGYGVACGFFISGSALPIHWNEYPQSVVHLKVDLDGRVLITSGASDIGQGSDTMLAIVVAEVLGLSMDNISVVSADTLLTPIDLGSYSSRVTFMAGNAAKMAAENLRIEILNAIAAHVEIPVVSLNTHEERVTSTNGKVNMSWHDAIEIATRKVGALNSTGYYNSPKLGGDFKGAGAGLSPSYSFGAVIAEVKVDTSSGQVIVENIWGAHDVGKAINPLAVEGQLEGSWHMGLGQALSEQMLYRDGLLVNGNLLDYQIPTTLDTPHIQTNYIESADPEGPFGAKECGEGALHPVIPAVANAIYDAIGVRVTSLPINPEEILKAIKSIKTETVV